MNNEKIKKKTLNNFLTLNIKKYFFCLKVDEKSKTFWLAALSFVNSESKRVFLMYKNKT
jgi:hypothetical protein